MNKVVIFFISTIFTLSCTLVNAAELLPNSKEQKKAPSNWKIYSIIENGGKIGDIGFYNTGSRLRYQAVNTIHRSYKLEVTCNHKNGSLSEVVSLRPGKSASGEFSFAQLRSGSCSISRMSVKMR